jgi:hypothetical protein
VEVGCRSTPKSGSSARIVRACGGEADIQKAGEINTADRFHSPPYFSAFSLQPSAFSLQPSAFNIQHCYYRLVI